MCVAKYETYIKVNICQAAVCWRSFWFIQCHVSGEYVVLFVLKGWQF